MLVSEILFHPDKPEIADCEVTRVDKKSAISQWALLQSQEKSCCIFHKKIPTVIIDIISISKR